MTYQFQNPLWKLKCIQLNPNSLETNPKTSNYFDKKPNRTPNHVKSTLLIRNHLKNKVPSEKNKAPSTYCTLKCMTHHLLMVGPRPENVHLNLRWLFLHICPILPHFDLQCTVLPLSIYQSYSCTFLNLRWLFLHLCPIGKSGERELHNKCDKWRN